MWDVNTQHYSDLRFNLTHIYPNTESLGAFPKDPLRHTPSVNITGITEYLYSPVNTSGIQQTLNNVYYRNQSRVFWQRPKIEWLVYGQSSTYKAFQDNPDLFFYAFNDVNGEPYEDWQWNEGKTVLHCGQPALGPGAQYVLKRLKANTEQSRGEYDGTSNQWHADNEGAWFVKPRIRVNANFINNLNNSEVEICKIHVIKEDITNKISPISIRAKHFRQLNQQYNGSYIEEFYFNQTPNEVPTGITFTGALNTTTNSWWCTARGTRLLAQENEDFNHADIKIEWLDNCDMWIDYVKVENEVADKLLKGYYDDPTHPENQWIKQEVDAVKDPPPGATDPVVYNFYIELFEYNNIPCMAYVNQKIKQYSGGKIGFMADLLTFYQTHLRWADLGVIVTPEKLERNFFDVTGFEQVFIGDPYPLIANQPSGCPGGENQQYSLIPNTLNVTPGTTSLYALASPQNYDAWLQGLLDTTCVIYEGGPLPANSLFLIGDFRYLMQHGNQVSARTNKPFIAMLQAHQWNLNGEVDREPTNEEQNLMVNEAVSYGAKGIIFWGWGSFHDPNYPECKYARGITGEDGQPRLQNEYGQQKWDTLKRITQRLEQWGPTLMSFDNTQTSSYIYRLPAERNLMYQNAYFYDIYTYKPGSAPFPCVEDYPEGDVPPLNTIGECKNERYLQIATFKQGPNDINNYFMILNKRCSPHKPAENENGGRRLVKVYFNQNAGQLERYENWKITNISDRNQMITYVKGQTLLDFGWFEPGEGKIFKMEPVMISGGELAGDEILSGETFTCEAPVYNNGFDITIEAGTTIHFNDSSRFVMNGGTFTVGNQNVSGSQNITNDAVNGTTWLGHSFTNCEVKIYGASFTGITNDTAYSLNIVDCPVVDIRNCTFNSAQSLKGAVNAVFYNNPFAAVSNVYLYGNTFNSSGSTIPTVNISSYAGLTLPLIIEGNTFNNGNTAIFLTGVTGGAIKGNTITDNYYGLNVLTSSVDIFENTINSSVNSSIGVFSAGGSEIRLNKAGSLLIGGQNTITNTGSASNNIKVEGAVFLLADGENVFDIASNLSAYHLYGWFPYFTAVNYDETDNCFKVDNTPVDPPVNLVTDGYQGSALSFTFQPYLTGCEIESGGDGLVINLGDGIYDTIYTGGSGSGGSKSGNNQIPLSRGVSGSAGRGVFLLTSAKTKYDSISVLMRYRNYPLARTKCIDLINTYPDSIQSLNAISKLFLASTASDTTINGANELKIYYENLILNYPNNVSLVKRANYFILKCKVRMRQYSQALSGFQQIINQNPYSYEGLIARWDYMATSLLVQGQGGGEPSITNYELGITGDSEDDIEGNDDDKKPFTKEQRRDIRKSINTVIEISKNDDEVKIKKLEKKSELGDVNASKELTQMKSLKQVVKTEKPKSITQHVRIVSEDIRKVFGTNTSSKGNEPKNIPLVFRLSQNYPNPFNPVTKINYDLPRDAKVTIIIYDILGREVKRLVNNELKTAGSNIIDFNASNYASGVYFYRIEAEELNGNKIVDSKKMVLLK